MKEINKRSNQQTERVDRKDPVSTVLQPRSLLVPRHDLSGAAIGLPISWGGDRGVFLGRQSVLAVPDRSCLGYILVSILLPP